MSIATLQFPVVALSTTLMHYAVLQQDISPMAATIPFLLFNIIIPMIRMGPANIWTLSAMAVYLSSALRYLDVAQLQKEVVHKWSFNDYCEYMISFEVSDKSPKKAEDKKEPLRTMQQRAVPYEDMTYDYLKKEAITLLIKFFVWNLILMHIILNRKDWYPKPYEIASSLSFMRDCYLLGIACAMALDMSFTLFNHASSLYFKIPFVPIMNHPYLATSVGDFWSNRWNLIVHNNLRRGIFTPFLRSFGYTLPLPKGVRIAPHVLMMGAFATFLFSGIFHEWMIFVMFELPTIGEQLSYFLVQGIMSTLEIVVKKYVLKTFGINLEKTIPYPIKIVYTNMVMILSSPLFLNPYIRENLLTKYHPGYALMWKPSY
ncbi:hypothetical protein BC833DRAFT_574137 [Globomyces pollinis-pini]|nr:hypothetical protein BC833DRAFT_574137 [Globomyces pollinis-pini]KAJ2996315.1 hypothetical protein HDV02_006636 [Globomyces sp. JEL0801]